MSLHVKGPRKTMLKKLGLMGGHISRSKMGKLQLFLADKVGENLQYELIDGEVKKDFSPVDCIDQLVNDGYHGINVTQPYKQIVHSLVTAPLVAGHDKIGSYNTLRFIDGKLYGANTDYSGFKRGYQFRREEQPPGKVLMCGAGGVGRAIAFGLAELGAEHIYIADVVEEQSSALVEALQSYGFNASAVLPTDVSGLQHSVDGLVNCTALGMYGKPGSPFDLTAITEQKWAFDAVYIPLKTEFIQQCESKGMACMTGFDLWIFQGLDAFTHFTGETVTADTALINEALSWLD
tara:strand:- start:430 stop:1305 length:876 start_codon:yes stop_codon:yes gene_type:complete